jgi:peptidoglycan/LPS O-acetylase OafA/YrhL
MEQPVNRHIDFLDPVRGIAILLVFVYHCLGTAFGHDQLPWGAWFRDFNITRSFLPLLPITFGWAGVAILFVISGFCIHLSFSRQPNWHIFLYRRFFRIYPPYLLALVLFAFLFPLTRFSFASPHGGGQFLSHLGLFHNFDERWFFGINPSFWSIAVEVQLYALYPLLLFISSRFGWARSLMGIAAIEITLRLIDGMLMTSGTTGLPKWLSGSPFFYWFSWSLGAFVAERHIRGTPIVTSRLFFYAVVIGAVGFSLFRPLSSMSFLLFALLTAGVVSRLLRRPGQPLPIPASLRTHLSQVGLCSYSLYLLHQPLLWSIPYFTAQFVPDAEIHPLLTFSLCSLSWFIIVPLACLSYHFVELPIIGLGKHFLARHGSLSKR